MALAALAAARSGAGGTRRRHIAVHGSTHRTFLWTGGVCSTTLRVSLIVRATIFASAQQGQGWDASVWGACQRAAGASHHPRDLQPLAGAASRPVRAGVSRDSARGPRRGARLPPCGCSWKCKMVSEPSEALHTFVL